MDNYSEARGFLPGLFGKPDDAAERKTPRLTKLVQRIPEAPRNHFVAMTGEFVGTFMFLFFAFAATQISNTSKAVEGFRSGRTAPQDPDLAGLMYVAVSFGFSLAVNAWIFYRISGGLFNPAVSLSLFLVGAIPPVRAALTFIAQILGATSCAAVVSALFPGPLKVTTRLGGDTSIVQGLFIEMFLTAGLVFTILMLAVEKTKATWIAPLGIGLALFITQLAGVYFTGASLNPARSIGPDIATRSFPGYIWIYWVGPGLGSIIATVFYEFLKGLQYETANPGQDHDDLEHTAANNGNGDFAPPATRRANRSHSRSQHLSTASTVSNEGIEERNGYKAESGETD